MSEWRTAWTAVEALEVQGPARYGEEPTAAEIVAFVLCMMHLLNTIQSHVYEVIQRLTLSRHPLPFHPQHTSIIECVPWSAVLTRYSFISSGAGLNLSFGTTLGLKGRYEGGGRGE